MIRALAFTVMMVTPVTTVSTQQSAADEQQRAAIRRMRAINTAEYAVKGRDGKFMHLTELLEHPSMGGVKPNTSISGGVVTHQGMTVRIAVSSNGTQYQVSIVPAETCGWAAFSDERGLIYTGKVLDC